MDSLTMKMERISYARILVEVDASKELVYQVEFILPNGVVRKQPIRYEFTPKFCTSCNHFGHLRDSSQGYRPTIVTDTTPAATVKSVAPKKAQISEWTLVQRRHKAVQKEEAPQPAAGESVEPAQKVQQQGSPTAGSDEQRQQGLSVHNRVFQQPVSRIGLNRIRWSILRNTHRQEHRVPPLIRAPCL
ncbi:UNVERIFIED_CONTAM: hypothetical protein Slati_0405200 [Sesamum latifolium]|uniref:Zinc knuckle CX2CX4HX4C domain-containing protein n=1 Tax=Sesamum latifolium TaxID=2727402 RepID=A0AAW2XUX5_9LAMI